MTAAAIAQSPGMLYLYILAGGFAAVYFWRFLGLLCAERLTMDSEILVWVRLVANALMAALVARIIFLPPGALADTSMSYRLIAVAMAVLAYWFAGRMLAIAVSIGVVVFLGLQILLPVAP